MRSEIEVQANARRSQRCLAALGLGRVKTVLREVNSESQAQRKSQASIAAIRRLVPMVFMTRVRL